MNPSANATMTNHRTSAVMASILFAGLLLLFLTTPAVAMNDPVVGRWLTRDPLWYNGKGSLHPRFRNMGLLQGTSHQILERKSPYLTLLAQPARFHDPYGLCCCLLPDRKFKKICTKISGATGCCEGTVVYPDWWPDWGFGAFNGPGPGPYNYCFEEEEFNYDCAACDPKCFPLFFWIPWSEQKEITLKICLPGSEDASDCFFANVTCEIEGNFWVSFWTCCQRK